MTNAFALKLARQLLFVIAKIVKEKFAYVNDMRNALGNFYSSPDCFIPLFSLFRCFLGYFRYICQRYFQSVNTSNFLLS